MSGIPEKLVVITRNKRNFVEKAGDIERKEKVREAFFVDAASEKSAETARNWARYPNSYRYSKPPPYKCEANSFGEETIPNKPFTNLKIVGLDQRMEGGRAYKVMDEQGRLFDLREDVLMECFFSDEVRGQMLTGQFVWAKNHTQMKVVRVGSKQYNELKKRAEEQAKKVTQKNLRVADLTIGGVYRTRGDCDWIYLGRVKGKGLLMMATNLWRNESYQKDFDERMGWYRANKKFNRMTEFKKSHSFVVRVGQVKIRIEDIELLGSKE